MEDRNNEDYKESLTDGSPAEETPVSDAAKTDEVQDGEYHFVRPESNLYEDAGFTPCEEDSEIPKYYVPNIPVEKDPKEKKVKQKKPHNNDGFVRALVLCLICAVLGGLGGGFLASELLSPDPNPVISPTDTPIKPTSAPTESTQPAVDPSSRSNRNTIYTLGCTQAVGVTTEVTTTNWFGQTSSSAVSGSGFVVTSDGYILTNYHVVEYAQKYGCKASVMFYDGKTYEAKIVGFEAENDIAVLKIDANELTPVAVGDSDTILVGDEVYAIGNPLGELAFSMTTGHVSALDRSIATAQNSPAINMFQFDAAVNSGNSGGPLYNENGEVIGVVTAKYSSSGVEGLSFAIPINDAIAIANDLITTGYVTGRAYLGAYIDNRYTSVYAEFYGMPEGAYVFNVEKGSCAEAAGLSAGDIITKLDDKDITSYSDLSSAIRSHKAGDVATLTVYRNNTSLELTVTFDEAKATQADSSTPEKAGDLSGYNSFTA